MRKLNIILSTFVLMHCLILMPVSEVFAESGEEYITIMVEAEDDNEGLMYSIDSTDESAFTSSNTFTIPAGTSHTIYVKDAAGNITSQDYSPQMMQTNLNVPLENENTQDINIDVEIGNKDYSSILGSSTPAEPGEGTMHDRTVTDGSDDGEKVFYTVTTAEGDTFYMVIDKNQNTDNVYLLNTVTRSDLAALAVTDNETEQKEGKEEDNLLTALQNEKEADNVPDKIDSSQKDGGISPNIIILVLALIIGGAYYYIKIYKAKKEQQMDVMDAMDMEDFVSEEDDEQEDEVEFDMADDEKQAFLNSLIDEGDESELYDVAPEDYAVSNDDDSEKADTEMFANFETDYDPELDDEDDEDDEEEE